MKKLMTGLLVAVFLGGVTATAVVFGGGGTAVAQEQEQHQEQQTPAPTRQTPATYKYVAQPGDSYTKMSRKAVQTYGKKHNVNLSLAEIVYAETNLTKEAGSPQLAVGQHVEFNEQTVRLWVERAQVLTDQQESAWNYYVQFVNFNTDNVGEAR